MSKVALITGITGQDGSGPLGVLSSNYAQRLNFLATLGDAGVALSNDPTNFGVSGYGGGADHAQHAGFGAQLHRHQDRLGRGFALILRRRIGQQFLVQGQELRVAADLGIAVQAQREAGRGGVEPCAHVGAPPLAVRPRRRNPLTRQPQRTAHLANGHNGACFTPP